MSNEVGLSQRRSFSRLAGPVGYPGYFIRCFLLLLFLISGAKARADATLLIEAPINFLGHISSTGHAALLIEDLCSGDHIHLRLCRGDETEQ